MSKKEELENCTFAKTVLMISIIFYHSIIFWRGGWNVVPFEPIQQSSILKWCALWFGGFQNYSFVFISGYIFYFTLFEKRSYKNILNLIEKKFCRLVIPFIFFGAIWVIPISILLFKSDFASTVINYYTVLESGQLWFLIMLFFVFLLFGGLRKIFKNNNMVGLILVMILYCIRIVGSSYIPGYFTIWNVCKYSIFFWMGFKTRQYPLILIRRIPTYLYVIIYTVVLVLGSAFTLDNAILQRVYSIGMDFVLHTIGAFMGCMVLIRIGNSVRWRRNRFFMELSSCNMVMFLVHQQIVYFTIYYLNGHIPPIANAIVNFLCAIVISFCIAKLIKKSKILSFFAGEKI